MNLPQPFSYRFRRHAAIILSARQIRRRHRAGARRKPGAGADARRDRRCPTCPPSTTKSPSSQLPEMPTWPTITQCRPMRRIVPDLTRLSILVPSPITVSPSAPRSMVVQAPISTSSWMMTRPSCGILTWPVGADGKAEARLADLRAGQDQHLVADIGVADGDIAADLAILADGDAAADHRVRADARAVADFGTGADHHARRQHHVLADLAAGDRPPSAATTRRDWTRDRTARAAAAKACCTEAHGRQHHARRASASGLRRLVRHKTEARMRSRRSRRAALRARRKRKSDASGRAGQAGEIVDRRARRPRPPATATPAFAQISASVNGPRLSKKRGSAIGALSLLLLLLLRRRHAGRQRHEIDLHGRQFLVQPLDRRLPVMSTSTVLEAPPHCCPAPDWRRVPA